MKTLMEQLQQNAQLNESKTSPREITNYIHSWFYNCTNLKELKIFFNSVIAGLNEGLEDINAYKGDDVELCETASEVIEQIENVCNTTLK